MKSRNDERFFEEKRTYLKYIKGYRVYIIHGEDYKRKSDLNPLKPHFLCQPKAR